jgi:glycosyltransferase involved in cell wall biosynthesis
VKPRPVALVLGPSLEAMSGVSTHVSSLLGSQLASDFRLVHFQVGSEGRSESAAGRLVRFAASPFRLAAAIVRHDACIVHINCSLNAKAYWRDLLHMVAAKLCGARVVFQKHGGDLCEFCGNGLFAQFVRLALRLPDAVVVLSQEELKAYRDFVPGQRIAAVPNGIDAEPYLRRNRPAADPAAALKLVYIGRLVPGKGLAESLEALALARAAGARARLVIAGSGAEEARLRALARTLGLGDEVIFAGPASGDAKAQLLCEADVLLLPSHGEGLPYSLLEAMAAGAVPVVTPVGAIPDVVIEGVHGRFVPVRDAPAIAHAIATLAADRPGLARMSQACRRRIARAYSLERLALELGGLYSSLSPWPASQAG